MGSRKHLWVEIGRAVYARRGKLDMTQAQLAAAAKVGDRTVRSLEAGHAPTRRSPSWPRVEQALGWPAGTIDRWSDQGYVDDPLDNSRHSDPGMEHIWASPYHSEEEKAAMADALRRMRSSRWGDGRGRAVG